MKYLKEALKKLDVWDIGFVKISVLLFTLWLVSLWPEFAVWAMSVDPWIFFALFIIAIIRPLYRAYLKK